MDVADFVALDLPVVDRASQRELALDGPGLVEYVVQHWPRALGSM